MMSVRVLPKPLLAWRGWTVMTLIVACAVAGCARTSDDGGRVRVRGTVAYRGEPVPRGTVLFASVGSRDVASTPIREGGAFEVLLLPGDYGAAVRCFADEQPTENPALWSSPKSLLPEKYADAATSGLTVTAAVGMKPIRLEIVP